MYASLNLRNIMFSIISKVLIYIVSYIFCFCEVIFGSRIILNYAIDPTNIDKHYLFWIYCSIVLLETFACDACCDVCCDVCCDFWL